MFFLALNNVNYYKPQAPIQGEVWGKIIQGKPGSNPRVVGTTAQVGWLKHLCKACPSVLVGIIAN